MRETAILDTVKVPSQAALLAELRNHIRQGQRFSVATMNLDHAVKLRQDASFRQAYAAQTHVTADGRPVVWLMRLAGRPVDLVTGSDLVAPLIALCAEEGVRVAMLGATETALNRAAERLRAEHPRLQITDLLSPPMGFDPEGDAADALIERLSRSRAQVCFLALGAPKQEKFAARALGTLPDMGFVSVGAGIDFVAGTQTRAPRLVRALALEWLWRLSSDPKRMFSRYARCAAILPALVGAALSMRRDRAVQDLK
jgi:exopolysaccharide biosynthesis WecB/TagA/CpsF family protein